MSPRTVRRRLPIAVGGGSGSGSGTERRALLQQQEQQPPTDPPPLAAVAPVSELYNKGATLVHEIGHWLNLFHTFQGGCADGATVGDRIPETPAENAPTFGCPAQGSVDTCPSLPGPDSLSNYMAYTSDACMYQFTPQQRARMQLAWTELRAGVPVVWA